MRVFDYFKFLILVIVCFLGEVGIFCYGVVYVSGLGLGKLKEEMGEESELSRGFGCCFRLSRLVSREVIKRASLGFVLIFFV